MVPSASAGPDHAMQDSDIVIKPRDTMPDGATTLPARYYVDETYFQREMDTLFSHRWVCVGRVEQVAAPGQFIVRDLLGESVIVTGGGDGVVRAFYNVCRHRGTRLCEAARAGSPASSGARTTPGPTTSTAGWSPRRRWTTCRTSARTTTRCNAVRGRRSGTATSS